MKKEDEIIIIEYEGLEVYYDAPYLTGLDREIRLGKLLTIITLILTGAGAIVLAIT
jgi:hypothetical protein